LKANVSLSQFSWKAVPQLRTCNCKTPVSIVASCCRFALQCTSLMWQNTADDDLRQRPTGSRQSDRLEPCRTVTGRPGWKGHLEIHPTSNWKPFSRLHECPCFVFSSETRWISWFIRCGQVVV